MSAALDDASGLPLLLVRGQPVFAGATSSKLCQLLIKRGLDIVLSLLLMVLLSPFLALLAISIAWAGRGSVLFKQKREGLNGTIIEVYKFRSMYVDQCDTSGLVQATLNDPRVTPIGSFIRKTSIDELPQLFNVLRGDMSLIGPRPHPVGMCGGGRPYRELVPYYQCRHLMKPGLSGWAQANGLRGPTGDAHSARARVEHDVAYIQNFSLWLDLKIAALTLLRELPKVSGV